MSHYVFEHKEMGKSCPMLHIFQVDDECILTGKECGGLLLDRPDYCPLVKVTFIKKSKTNDENIYVKAD
jgi:hypothetical protein